MKFTVGIPCWNQAQYLAEAIESALNQTVECEVIVVNDGSPDETEAVAKRYPVKYISQVNKGLASARNAAIMNMTGDFFLPLDADDILTTQCVEIMLRVAKATKADVIAPSIRCFGKNSGDVIVMENPTFDDFKEGNRIPYCSAIKREALLECGGYSPKMDGLGGWEDLHLWYDLMSRGKKIVGIPEILVFYLTKEKSMWLDAEKNKDNLWRQLIKDFPEVMSHRK